MKLKSHLRLLTVLPGIVLAASAFGGVVLSQPPSCLQNAGWVQNIAGQYPSYRGSVAQRRMAQSDEWQDLFGQQVLCPSDTLRVGGEDAAVDLFVYGKKTRVESGQSFQVPDEPESEAWLAIAERISVVFGKIFLSPDEAPRRDSLWRGRSGEGYAISFATAGLDTGEARIAADGFDGKLTFAWYGRWAPASIKILLDEPDGKPIFVKMTPEYRPVGPDQSVRMLTIDTGELEPATYFVELAEESASATGSFSVVEGRRPILLPDAGTMLSLNMQSILDHMYLGAQHPEEWSFQGLQVFHDSHPDVPQEALLEQYLFNTLPNALEAIEEARQEEEESGKDSAQ